MEVGREETYEINIYNSYATKAFSSNKNVRHLETRAATTITTTYSFLHWQWETKENSLRSPIDDRNCERAYNVWKLH